MKAVLAHFLRSCAPAWLVLVGYVAVMPLTGSVAWSSLAWYQQAINIAAAPAILWSVYRFNVGLDDTKPTPEERILDESEGWVHADD